MSTSLIAAAAVLLSLSVAGPALAQSTPAGGSPAAAIARTDAQWAERRADERLTEGDYDGAIQAQGRADADRRAAYRMEIYARAPDPRR